MSSEAERTTRQKMRYDRRNFGRRPVFAKTDVAPKWVHNDTDLAAVWALYRPVTTAKMTARRRRFLDGELAELGEEWSLSDGSANAGRDKTAAKVPEATPSLAATEHHMMQQEAEGLLHEREAAVGQGCRGPRASFRH
ncbi:Importin subunit beta-1 [Hordeum vulgare]|nr:Importin subunit beta-1 [Hordeum vulgare]